MTRPDRAGGTSKTDAPHHLLPHEVLAEASECLRVMAHPLRLRMVEILMQGDFPVHRIAAMCGLPPAQACEHLRLLRGQGLLTSARRGRIVYYKIASAQLPALIECIRRCCTASRPWAPHQQRVQQVARPTAGEPGGHAATGSGRRNKKRIGDLHVRS